MEMQQLRELILKELPTLMRQDSSLREWVLNISRTQFADKVETESRFDQMMRVLTQKIEEDRIAREEQNRKWEEQNCKWEEQNRKWEDQNRKWEDQNSKWKEQDRKWAENQRQLAEMERKSDERWEANQKVINEMLAAIKRLDKKHDQTIGALGARWGLNSEESFRNGLAGILQELPSGIEVTHVNEFDNTGEVFGRPEQVELDLIIRNGTLLIAEIKSSMSRGEMYLFERKARFYEKKHQKTAQRLIVISPMVDKRALEVANQLGIKVYSCTDDVEFE